VPSNRVERARIEAMYRTHGHVVLRRARRMLGSDEEGAEAVQELFASLLASPGQFAERSSVVTFLYAATTNLCLNRIRDRRTRARLLETRVAPSMARRTEASSEQALAVRQLLARLPDDLAEVAVYAYFDELTQEEIAEVMGCSRRHVQNLLGRLRTRLEDEDQEVRA
jgi:RNA polymerase sigma-70 factor (ECF subfamily)